jgi:hypothetical protein
LTTTSHNSSASPRRPRHRPEFWLLILFLVTLPLINPWVRGDGVGYYAYLRAPIIEHSLNFENDYRSANASFRGGRVDENGNLRPEFRTPTGHLENHFTIGPAILWSPFFLLAHAGVLLSRLLGAHVAADGFSSPYRISMAFASALYAFLALLLSFRLARRYVDEWCAFLATIAIWWASSLAIYMYFNPSWSHALSAFIVALFIWCWHETRPVRRPLHWLLLGLITGIMLDVYYPNAMVLVILLIEAPPQYAAALRSHFAKTPPAAAVTAAADAAVLRPRSAKAPGGDVATAADAATPVAPTLSALLANHALFAATAFVCFVPTLLAHHIIYGNALESGYVQLRDWLWRSPVFFSVLFSSEHGLLSWTPLLLFSLIGLVFFARRKPSVGVPLLAAACALYLFISCYPDWAGISSYGNRFFVSITMLFVVGLAVFLDAILRLFPVRRRAFFVVSSAVLSLFMLWNVGLMFQWGSHLVPARGPISFPEMIHNQFFVVPQQLNAKLQVYLFRRRKLMQQIEDGDLQQLKQHPPAP